MPTAIEPPKNSLPQTTLAGVGGLYLLAALVNYGLEAGAAPGGAGQPVDLGNVLVLAIAGTLFVALAVVSARRPRPSVLGGLGLFLFLQLRDAIPDPAELQQSWGLRLLILAALFASYRTAVTNPAASGHAPPSRP